MVRRAGRWFERFLLVLLLFAPVHPVEDVRVLGLEARDGAAGTGTTSTAVAARRTGRLARDHQWRLVLILGCAFALQIGTWWTRYLTVLESCDNLAAPSARQKLCREMIPAPRVLNAPSPLSW